MSPSPTLVQPVEVPRQRFEQEVLQHRGQVLVELWRPGANTQFFTKALWEQAQRHPDVKVVRINVDEYQDLIEEYHRRRAINQTYDLAHVPGVALFRNGRLITSMKPLVVNSDPALIAYNVRRQLDVFLAKFVEDVKTTVATDESDAPGGSGGDAPASDKDAKIKAALEKAAKLKAERAKKAAQGATATGAGSDAPAAAARPKAARADGAAGSPDAPAGQAEGAKGTGPGAGAAPGTDQSPARTPHSGTGDKTAE